MGDTFRERKQTYGTLSTTARIELVDALKREKDKTARHLADAKAQREKAKQTSLKTTIVLDPSASRPFKDLIAKAERNHAALTTLDFSVGAWWLSGADVIALAEVLKRNFTVTGIDSYVCSHIYVCVLMFMCVYTYIHIYICIYIYIYIHMGVCIYTYIHVYT